MKVYVLIRIYNSGNANNVSSVEGVYSSKADALNTAAKTLKDIADAFYTESEYELTESGNEIVLRTANITRKMIISEKELI